uniref:Integrator complex subunit 4 n=1 Tax=Globodera rostochiensis TaxID=31243 RepID=A0A914HEW1_GLORO
MESKVDFKDLKLDNYSNSSNLNSVELESELIRLTCHFDRRVRTFAVRALEQICGEIGSMRVAAKACLSLEYYAHLAKLCKNSEQNVRVAALRILTRFAFVYPEEKVTTSKGFKIRLHDDAFSIVCDAMNDLEVKVRAQAANLLGTFENVSASFLDQTLDKKLMRNMTMLSDSNKNVKNVTTGAGYFGGWSTGKKMGEDVPMEKQEEESQSLIPTGSCGAFVTALEDEFMAVRQAAVYSLGKLAMGRPAFANACIDHLADMFNDEIQQIRLDAIRALTPVISHGILHRDQLDTILTVVDDATADNRMALHALLAKCNLTDSNCVLQCLKKLLHSLRRFPMDKFSIFSCLSDIGRRHPSLVQPLINDLLDIHPIFDTPEQSIDDDFYLARLILVLNAASHRSVICSLIPIYALKHYRYLRRSWPDIVPKISEFEQEKVYHNDSTAFALLPLLDGGPEKTEIGKKSDLRTARVLEPSKEFRNNETIRFVAGLPTGIFIRCLLVGVLDEELSRFRIQVEYPDQTFDFHRPRRGDFLRLDSRTVHLQTNVVVSAQRWATSASVIFTPGIVSETNNGNVSHKIVGKGGLKGPNQPHITPLASAENTARKCKISFTIHPMQQA